MVERQPVVRGGLKLPEPAGVSEHEHARVIREWHTLEEAESWLVTIGVTDENRPADITGQQLMTITSNEYSELFNQHQGWFTFLTPHMARIRAGILEKENTIKYLEAKIRKQVKELSRDKRPSIQELEDATRLDQYLSSVVRDLQILEQRRILLSAEIERADSIVRSISRQVEIRREEFSGERRGGNIQHGGAGAHRSPAVEEGQKKYSR